MINLASKTQMVKFEVYMTCGSDGNPLNIEELLKAINKIDDRDKKIVTQYGIPTRLDKFHEVIVDSATLRKFSNMKLLYFHMSKLRDDPIAVTRQEVDELSDLDLDADEYIAEDINCLFDTENCILFIQRNFHSLSVSGVAFYLKKMYERLEKAKEDFNVNDFEELSLEFQPVPDKKALKEIQKSDNIRTLELTFANANVQKFSTGIAKYLGGFKQLFDSLGGARISINLSAGAPKNKSLKVGDVHELAKNIESGKSLFSSAIIRGKEGDMPIEKYDLINGKLFVTHKFSSVKSEDGKTKKMHLRPDSVEDVMKNIYLRESEDGTESLLEETLRNIN